MPIESRYSCLRVSYLRSDAAAPFLRSGELSPAIANGCDSWAIEETENTLLHLLSRRTFSVSGTRIGQHSHTLSAALSSAPATTFQSSQLGSDNGLLRCS
jgi:hypothetical protein